MFRGQSAINVDAKGRLAVPARFREVLARAPSPDLVLTLNPWDRALWVYPLHEWVLIEAKLAELSDIDQHSRRTKQVMRGYASDCVPDGHGRILLPPPLREIASIERQVTVLGQGNKFELWDSARWQALRDQWFGDVAQSGGAGGHGLDRLAL